MAETIKIGGELESIATGNKVADVANIKDKTQGDKSQAQINADINTALNARYLKTETYNKTELDNKITTPEIAYNDYDTYADMVAETVHPNGAIYRVANYDGTQAVTNKYAEYSWDGTQYKLMAVRDHGIDDEPTADSNNLVKSGGVYGEISQLSQGINKQRTTQLYNNLDTPSKVNCTSNRLIFEDENAVSFVVKVDASIGDSFACKFIGQSSTVVTLKMFATNSLNAGDYCLQLGSATPSYMRGLITLEQDSTYIVVSASNVSVISEATIRLLKETLVLVKSSDYPTKYIPYKELLIVEDNLSASVREKLNHTPAPSEIGAIAVEQGVENVHKAMVVNSEGDVITKTLGYPELESSIPFKRTEQLFDKENVVLYNMYATTGSKTFYNLDTAFMFVISCNVSIGDSLKFSPLPTPQNTGIFNFGAGIGNNLPVENEQYIAPFSTNSTYMRGTLDAQSSASYIYIWFQTDSENYDSDLQKVLDSLVVIKSSDYPTEYIPYKVIDIEDEITIEELGGVVKQQGSVNYGKFLVVGADGNVTLGDGGGEEPTYSSVKIIDSIPLYLGADIMNNPTIPSVTGWSGDLANGIRHASGTDILVIQQATTQGKKYLVEFTLSQSGEAGLWVTIGDLPFVDVYNGTTTIKIGFISDGGYLKFKAAASVDITINNITIKEVVDEEDAVETISLSVKNVDSGTSVDNITGFWNVVLGADNTMQRNQNGSRNISIGRSSMSSFESGTRNIVLGTYSASHLVEGNRNVVLGADAFYFVKKAEDNISLGYRSLGKMAEQECYRNIAIGTYSMDSFQDGSENNVAVGYYTCNYSGSNNVGIGYQACYGKRGNNNTAVGYYSQGWPFSTGERNTSIGANSQCGIGGSSGNLETVNNSIAIGYDAKATKSNQCVIGNSDITEFVFGNKKINFNNDNSVTWETIS